MHPVFVSRGEAVHPIPIWFVTGASDAKVRAHIDPAARAFAAAVGFDWTTAADVIGKIEEEVAELRETLTDEPDNRIRAEEEMGDLLFAIANLSRTLGIEPEAALRRANDKFTERFSRMEERIASLGRHITNMSLEDLEADGLGGHAREAR